MKEEFSKMVFSSTAEDHLATAHFLIHPLAILNLQTNINSQKIYVFAHLSIPPFQGQEIPSKIIYLSM